MYTLFIPCSLSDENLAQHPGIYNILTPAFQLANTLMDEQIAIPRLANLAIYWGCVLQA